MAASPLRHEIHLRCSVYFQMPQRMLSSSFFTLSLPLLFLRSSQGSSRSQPTFLRIVHTLAPRLAVDPSFRVDTCQARPPIFLFSSPPLLLSLPFQKVSNGFRPRYRRFAPLSPNGRTESDPRLEEVTLLDHDRGEERSVCFPRSRVSVPWHTNKCIDRYTLLARPRLKVQQSPASWTGRANRLASRDNAYTLAR